MMSKEKSNSMKQLKYSIALPLATVTMFLCILCCTSRRYP